MVPAWAWFLGVGAAVLWFMGWKAANFRLRLNLVSHLLEQALAQQAAVTPVAADSFTQEARSTAAQVLTTNRVQEPA